MSRGRISTLGFALCAATCASLVCGCLEAPPTAVSIAGTVTYPGAPAGKHLLIMTVWDGVVLFDFSVIKAYKVSGNKLNAGFDYVIADVPEGVWYVHAYWDINDNIVQDSGDAVGKYGEAVLGDPVIVVAGQTTTGIDIELEVP